MSFKKIKTLIKSKRILDVSSLWISQLGAVFIAFITQLILARTLNVEEYGSLTTAINIVTILGGIASFGAGSNWLRVFGTEGWNAVRWVKPTVKINLIILSCIIVVFIIIIEFINLSNNTRLLMFLFISTLVSLGLANAGEAVYQLEEEYKKLALLKFLIHGLRFLVVLLAVVLGYSLSFIGIGYSLSSLLITCIYVYLIFRIYKSNVKLKGHGIKPAHTKVQNSMSIKETISYLIPYGATSVFYLIYFQSNIFIISILLGDKSAAVYNVAFTIINVVFLFPTTFYQSYLVPKVHKWGENNEQKISTLYIKGSKIVILLGIVLMLGIAGTSNVIIPLLFGSNYSQSSLLLMLLAITIPIRLLCNNLGSILVTEKHVVKKAYYQFIGAVVSVVFNIIFISAFGIYGAALASILTEIVVASLFVIGVKYYVPILNNYKFVNISHFSILGIGATILVGYYFYIIATMQLLTINVFAVIGLFILFIIYFLKVIKDEKFTHLKNELF